MLGRIDKRRSGCCCRGRALSWPLLLPWSMPALVTVAAAVPDAATVAVAIVVAVAADMAATVADAVLW